MISSLDFHDAIIFILLLYWSLVLIEFIYFSLITYNRKLKVNYDSIPGHHYNWCLSAELYKYRRS